MICNKSEGCKSSCWHKEQHETIYECELICPINSAAICIDIHKGKVIP